MAYFSSVTYGPFLVSGAASVCAGIYQRPPGASGLYACAYACLCTRLDHLPLRVSTAYAARRDIGIDMPVQQLLCAGVSKRTRQHRCTVLGMIHMHVGHSYMVMLPMHEVRM